VERGARREEPKVLDLPVRRGGQVRLASLGGRLLRHEKAHTPVIERWNGRRWSVQRSPGTPASSLSQLSSVTATSASNAWAVGEYQSKGHTFPLVEHWNGHSWRLQPAISPGSENILFGVSALTRTRAWAADAYVFGSNLGTLVESWDGGAWSEPSTPGQDLLQGVAVVSGRDAWAVGYRGHYQTLIERWNGTTWTVQPSPN
jgi:hypothetical protein